MTDCEDCVEAYEFQCNLCACVFCLDHASKHACPVLARLPANVSGYRRQRRKRGRRWDTAVRDGWYDSSTGLGMNRDQMRYWQRAWPGRESNERGRHGT